MESRSITQHNSQHLDPQNLPPSADGITHPQKQQDQPGGLPKSLIEWLARINRRYLALERQHPNHPD